jgi:hypothetical protein
LRPWNYKGNDSEEPQEPPNMSWFMKAGIDQDMGYGWNYTTQDDSGYSGESFLPTGKLT